MQVEEAKGHHRNHVLIINKNKITSIFEFDSIEKYLDINTAEPPEKGRGLFVF